MATRNEKLMAQTLLNLITDLRDQGFDFSKGVADGEVFLNEILDSDEKTDDRFFYDGVKAVEMSQEERDALGVCEFTVTHRNEVVLRVYWDPTLEWIMQPSEDGESFQPSVQKKFPGRAYARGFLKKLAEEEIANPGSFAKKYYRAIPKAFVKRRPSDVAMHDVA